MNIFNNHDRSVWTCALSILVLNYNCAITSYTLYFADEDSASTNSPDFLFATLSVILGLLVGQVLFGAFGDALGRRISFRRSSVLMLAGGALSVFTGEIPLLSAHLRPSVEFGVFRFVLGLGAGGLYPLVAALTRESCARGGSGGEDEANATVAFVFGPVGSLGLVAAPLAVYFLTLTDLRSDWRWRVLLLLGVLPSAALLLLEVDEVREHRLPKLDLAGGGQQCPSPGRPSPSQRQPQQLSSFALLLRDLGSGAVEASFWPYLAGTSAAWFCADLLHYVNLLFQVQFVDRLLQGEGYDDDGYAFPMRGLALVSAASALLFWLGGLASVLALRSLSALALQLHGFSLCAAGFFAVSVCKAALPPSWWPVTIGVYAATHLFRGFGPSPTTFLLPSLLFPQRIRSTANGLAAAAGKAGAVVGVVLVGAARLEIANLMALCGGVSALGIAATLCLVRAHIRANSSAAVVGDSTGSSRSPKRRVGGDSDVVGYGTAAWRGGGGARTAEEAEEQSDDDEGAALIRQTGSASL